MMASVAFSPDAIVPPEPPWNPHFILSGYGLRASLSRSFYKSLEHIKLYFKKSVANGASGHSVSQYTTFPVQRDDDRVSFNE